jgi:MFS family permease
MEARPRDLRVVAGAIAVSTMGDFVAAVALALQTNELWKGIGVSVIFIALWSPIVLLAGHAGLVVDRFETRRVAIAAALFQCVVAAALAFVTSSVTAILALTALLGVGAAFGQSAEFALVPLLAGPRSLSRANGAVESARGLGFALGPLIGGALAAGLGTRWAMLVDSASFLLIAVALASVAVRRRVSHTETAGFRARDGLTMLFAERTLAIATIAGALTLVFMSATIPADFVYTIDELDKSALALGLVITLWAAAMILASLLVAPRVPAHAVAVGALLAASVQGFAKFVAPFWMVFPFMCACYLVGGAGHGVKNTLFRTLIHQRVEPSRHGQAFAAYNGLRNGAELIALAAGGVLVAAIGGAGTLWLAGGAAGVVGLAGAVLLSTRGADQPAAARANAS